MSVPPFDLDRLGPRYSTIFCDLWGVVHDGYHLFAGAAERLARWTAEGRTVILITNAPRPATRIHRQLARLELPRSCYRDLSTGGQAGIDALKALGRPVGVIGPVPDRADLEEAGLRFVDGGYRDLAVIGPDEARPAAADYHRLFERLVADGVLFHCLNPDRVVVHGGRREICAGALADDYQALGGEVCWYGKPAPAIYDHALQLAGDPPRSTVLAVGDGLQTDVLGAARNGFDCLFVSGGIHAGEPFPADFASRHDLGDWRPIGTVDGID